MESEKSAFEESFEWEMVVESSWESRLMEHNEMMRHGGLMEHGLMMKHDLKT